MRVLVTGITGRVGANVAKALLDAGDEVRGLVWPEDPSIEKLEALDVELVYGDLRSYDDLCKAVNGMDAVCALAAAFQRRDGGSYDPQEYFETNVAGLYKFLEAVLASAPNIQHIVFASSDAVYEKYLPGGLREPISEATVQPKPRGWYALSKALGEEMLWAYYRQYNLPVTALRFASIVTPNEFLSTSVSSFFSLKSWIERVRHDGQGQDSQAALRILEALWPGEDRLLVARMMDGRSHKKGIADVRDIVQGVVKAIKSDACIGEAVHVSSIPFTWAEAVPYLSGRIGMPYVDARLPTVPTYYEFDLSRAKRLIGYEPKYDILRMIDDALAFQRGEEVGVIPR